MHLITVTSDFGYQDYYLALFKGKLHHAISSLQIIDVSHNTLPFHKQSATFQLKNVWKTFPKQTIHILRANETESKEYLITSRENHLFIVPNNGVISLLFEDMPSDTYKVDYTQYGSRNDCLSQIAKQLVAQESLSALGEHCASPFQLLAHAPTISQSILRGVFQHIDHYGNLISNLTRDLFEKQCLQRDYAVHVRGIRNARKILTHFSEVDPGDIIIRFNSEDLLMIAIHQGNAHELLGLSMNDVIDIRFL